MICPSCAAENRPGAKFCVRCGAGLELACPSCSAAYEAGDLFCAECGTALTVRQTGPADQRPAPASERRLVSVLFADLVGFTTLSEARDPEEVRELLSGYFELARTLIGRYGGTVEKFIGDAVMAVWGTPTATEDDAERAVRAALDLVASVPELDGALQVRAAVLTGEAAVTIGAAGEGMVAGDLVNTASRVQSLAEPGAVLVGESTRRASEQSIVYEAAGERQLKGKVEPVGLWRALRVVSGVGGQLKSVGLEAPFVGRDRELRLIKDVFHACAEERRARLVSVTGIAGIGKSRLAWEFYKYFDGIVDTVWWHRGRCLAYGEGVAYWALADMVRMRCRIAEDEEPQAARSKLRAAVEEHVLDRAERAFVEPRLAHLIGLEEFSRGDRGDLFAAWRLFFERLADSNPTVLAFEDMQWADASLLDFVEYLLDWSRDYPLFVITLARPELHERRGNWGAGQRNFTSLYLEPLAPEAMERLLEGLVPGLPDRPRAQILARAEGVPLYAVETVRMLLDRGLLVQEGPVYRSTGEIDALEVPETLHALIAARLDGVSPEERRLLQDGAVLGKTFTKAGLAALWASRTPSWRRSCPPSCARRYSAPSPIRARPSTGSTASCRTSSATSPTRRSPDGNGRAAIWPRPSISSARSPRQRKWPRSSRRTTSPPSLQLRMPMTRRRSGLGPERGWRSRASGRRRSGRPRRRGVTTSRLQSWPTSPGGRRSCSSGRESQRRRSAPSRRRSRLLERAVELYRAEGATHAAARVSAWLGWTTWFAGDLERASQLLEQAFDVLADEKPDADLAELAEVRARLRHFLGDNEGASERVERASRSPRHSTFPPCSSTH